MANKHRGEITVALGSRQFTLLPTFEAVAAIEAALGSVIALTKRGINDASSLTMTELAVVVTEGIRAHGRATGSSDAHSGVDVVKRLIFEAGLPRTVPAVIDFLAAAVTGGSEATPGND